MDLGARLLDVNRDVSVPGAPMKKNFRKWQALPGKNPGFL